MGIISQTFRTSAELDKKGFFLLQKWNRLSNETRQNIIKTVIADGLRSDKRGTQIKDELEKAINAAMSDQEIAKLNF
jgi:hypothetical protein